MEYRWRGVGAETIGPTAPHHLHFIPWEQYEIHE